MAFCLLSRANQTVFHSPRPYSCSCNVHYLYHKPTATEDAGSSVGAPRKYHTNYLRLTPICALNESGSILEQYQTDPEAAQAASASDFVLRGLDGRCDYKLMFLDCDAMTTTTTTTTTTTPPPTTTTTTAVPETSTTSEPITSTTTELVKMTTTTPWSLPSVREHC